MPKHRLSKSNNQPVLDFTSHCHECLLHISGILGTGLKEGNANLISKGLHDIHHLDIDWYSKRALSCGQPLQGQLVNHSGRLKPEETCGPRADKSFRTSSVGLLYNLFGA